jgi:hypothetical protein
MYNDADVQKWIEHHGVATSFTFLVYGEMQSQEVDLLIKGLIFRVDVDIPKMAIFFDVITEDQAVAWNTYRGTTITFVFAGDKLDIEEEVRYIILDGLEYLRYKADYLCSSRGESFV